MDLVEIICYYFNEGFQEFNTGTVQIMTIILSKLTYSKIFVTWNKLKIKNSACS